jgi:hypothetical protein
MTLTKGYRDDRSDKFVDEGGFIYLALIEGKNSK